MNTGVISIRNNRVMFLMMILIVIGGYHAYQTLGRLEDPEFTIKEALIVTTYPGASPEEVAQEVTNPIESAVQQLGQLSRLSEDRTGEYCNSLFRVIFISLSLSWVSSITITPLVSYQNTQTLQLPNVLAVSRRLGLINTMLQEREVVKGTR